jgi:hypothetical protein
MLFVVVLMPLVIAAFLWLGFHSYRYLRMQFWIETRVVILQADLECHGNSGDDETCIAKVRYEFIAFRNIQYYWPNDWPCWP